MKPLCSFSQMTGKPFIGSGGWEDHLLRRTLIYCLSMSLYRVWSCKCKTNVTESIKEALTSLNYRLCKIKYAGLFGGNNVSGWQSHVIFSMLLARGLHISQPHLQLFLTHAAYEIDSTVCAWMKKLTLFLFVTLCNRLVLWWCSADCGSDVTLHKRRRLHREQF